MKGTILEKIIDAKRERVAASKRIVSLEAMTDAALKVRASAKPHRLYEALSDRTRLNIIAEFKRASPSKGLINGTTDPVTAARSYEAGGAAAMSVLTEEDLFKGSLSDLRVIREAVDIPILRKDFIFDAFQIYEAAEAGADAILLIAAMLDDIALAELYYVAETGLQLDVLVEVHSLDEIVRAESLGARIIGVNNRDLRTFHVSLDVSRELIGKGSSDALFVSESGLTEHSELVELSGLGYSGFLIGETLMLSENSARWLRGLQ